MTNSPDEKVPVAEDEQASIADKSVEEQELSKETLEDLDAPEEEAEDAKGGFRSQGCYY